MSADVLSIDKDRYSMLDMHGSHVCFLHIDEARDLLKRGLAKTFGSKKRVHGIQLLVAIVETEHGMLGGKAMSPANYAGCRFIFKQHVSNGHGYMVVYRMKHLEVVESPEHALLRILTAPALESAVYTRRENATETERAADPGQDRRKRQREIFRFTPGLRYSAKHAEHVLPSTGTSYAPLQPATKPRRAA